MKKILFLLVLSSCYQKPNKLRIKALPYTPPIKDCNKLMVRMTVLKVHDNLNPGSEFARIVAVDKQDGTMSVKILPPEGQDAFPLKEDLAEKELRFIACYENFNSVKNGATFTGACSPFGAVNILGGVNDVRFNTHLSSEGFKAKICNTGESACWSYVHDTRNPYLDAAKYMPTSIMFVASDGINHNNDYIIAIGDSPYKACYFNR